MINLTDSCDGLLPAGEIFRELLSELVSFKYQTHTMDYAYAKWPERDLRRYIYLVLT